MHTHEARSNVQKTEEERKKERKEERQIEWGFQANIKDSNFLKIFLGNIHVCGLELLQIERGTEIGLGSPGPPPGAMIRKEESQL